MGSQDVEAAAAEYSRRWLPNAHAVATLTEEGFGGNKRAFALNLKLVQVGQNPLLPCSVPAADLPAAPSPRGPPTRPAAPPTHTHPQLITQVLLNKLLPFAVPQPAFLALNTTSVSYADILRRSSTELRLFKAVLVVAAAAAAAALWRRVGPAALAALGLA